MADVEKLQSLDGILDYPDPNDASKGTTEQQFQEWLKNQNSVASDVVNVTLWQPSTAYEVGQVVCSPNMQPNTVAKVTTAGNTAAAEPAWGAVDTTIADGTVTYKIMLRTIEAASLDEANAGTDTHKIITPAVQFAQHFLTASELSGTIDDLYTKRKNTTGGVGSVSLMKKSSGIGSEIPAGWYNYIYTPHRFGIGSDNYQYATVILCPMNFVGNSYIVRFTSGAIADVKVITTGSKIDNSDAGLWDYLHRKGGNFAIPTTNTAINALGMFLSYYTSKVIAHQPSQYGQLFNIPASRAGTEATQLWFEQDSGRMWHRGGNSSDIVNNQAFLRFLDESDLTNINNNVNGRGVIAGNVSNANSWWVKLGGTIPLIIQGGISATGNVTFPIAFPSVVFAALTNVKDYSEDNRVTWGEWSVTSLSKTGFTIEQGQRARYWVSLGY